MSGELETLWFLLGLSLRWWSDSGTKCGPEVIIVYLVIYQNFVSIAFHTQKGTRQK